MSREEGNINDVARNSKIADMASKGEEEGNTKSVARRGEYK